MNEITNDDLPEGWTKAALQDIAAWGSGGTPSRKNPAYFGGDIPWIKTGELDAGLILQTEEHLTPEGLKNSSAKVFPKGAVAVAMYGATIGKASILGIEAATNQACAVAIPNERATTSRYLFHYLRSQKEAFIQVGKGGAQPNISQGLIKEWPIPLAPVAEQKRIADKLAAVLGRVDSCRARLDRVPGLLKRFRLSVLAAASSGQLTEDWRKAHAVSSVQDSIDALDASAKTRRGVTDSVGAVPEALTVWECPSTWAKATAGQLISKGIFIDLKDGNHGSNHPKVSEFTSDGLPFITAAQVRDFQIDYDDAYKIDGEPLSKLRVGFAKADDVILTHKGTVGRVAVADRDCILTPQTTYYRVNPKWLEPKYLMYFLASSAFGNQLDEIKSQTTRDFVPISQQYSLGHLIPTRPEQQEIVRRVEALFALADRIEARLATAQRLVERLTPATLSKAFRGDLVPQDPKDEPASQLLERLKDQSQDFKGGTRKGRTKHSA